MSRIANKKCGRYQWLLCSCCLLVFLSSSAEGQTRGSRLNSPRSGSFRIESKIQIGGSNSTNGGAGQSGTGIQGKLVTGMVRMKSGQAVSVEYVVRDGLAIFQGDIILGKVDSQNRVLGSRSTFSRANVAKDKYRWPGGVIPYVINSSINDNSIRIRDNFTDQTVTLRTGVLRAIGRWTQQTNITMRRRRAGDTDYVLFILAPATSNFSSSSLGRVDGAQRINVSSGANVGGIQHEIGHTAGLWHEQSRADRNQFIKVEWDNIIDNKNIKHQYEIQSKSGDMSGPYDYDSIMHYPSMVSIHAKDPTKPVITPLNGISLNRIGQRTRLSQGDIAAINALYPEPTWSGSIYVPNQTSKVGPATAVFQNRLYMVHLGKKSNDIYHSYFDGTRWSTELKIPGQSSKAAPALAVHGGRLHMVHLGNSSNDIWHSTFNGSTWTKNVKIPGQTSKATPALASYRNELHLVHLGNKSNDIWHSRFNGSTWTKNVKISGQTSRVTPALAVYQGSLHMVHLGKSSKDIWRSNYNGARWSPDVKINSQRSFAAPSLTMFKGNLYMFHLGAGSKDIWYSQTDSRGKFRPDIRMPNEKSSHPVAVAEFNNQLIMVHKGGGSTYLYRNSFGEPPTTMITAVRGGQQRRGGTYRTGKVVVKRRP